MPDSHTTTADLHEIVYPGVLAERCVHGRSPIAQCSACVSACPLGAFTLNDEGLDIDQANCDGCALCAASCPEAAIEIGQAVRLLKPKLSGATSAFAACERVLARGEPGHVTCLHALTSGDLARFYSDGGRSVVVAKAPCDVCARGRGTPIEERVAGINRLLEDRGLRRLEVQQLDISSWREDRDDQSRISRRSLFGFARRGDEVDTSSGARNAADPSGIAPGALLPEVGKAQLAAVGPSLDRDSCTACGACIAICPHRVLTLVRRQGGHPRYEFDATGCTGCGLCVDVCDVNAIALTYWTAARPAAVELIEARCPSCASPFRAILGREDPSGLCAICASKPRKNMLFQKLP